MDRRTLLAIILCFGIFLAWQKLYVEPRLPQQQAQTSSQVQAPSQNQAVTQPPTAETASPSASAEVRPARTKRPAVTLPMSSMTGQAQIGDDGKFFVGWSLTGYHQGLSKETAPIDLGTVTNQDGQMEIAFDDPSFAYLSGVQGNIRRNPLGILWSYEDANVKMERQFSGSNEKAYLDVNLSIQFKGKRPNYAFVSLSSQKSSQKDPEERDRQLDYWSNDSLDRVQVKDNIKLREIINPVKYVAAANRYFIFAAINNGPVEPRGLIQPLPNAAARASLVYPLTSSSIQIPLKIYFGPKELQTLRLADTALDNTVDFGWFTLFAYPLLKFLKWLDQFVRNYGVAIILLTAILKIALYPLTYKSMKSMKEMAKIQPQIQRLREKHKDDPKALNSEMITLMRSHGYNPLAGCLPMVIQMPIFFALYRVLYSSIELYHAPLGGWIKDLSAADPLYVTPVLLSLLMYLQQKMTPNTATDPTQQKMMQFMPLIFGLMMINLPAGLTLYMLTNSVLGIFQQAFLNKKFNTGPHVPPLARARA